MTLLLECIIGCIVFTVIIVLASKNPIDDINNYPPAIIERCKELGLITHEQEPKSKSVIIKKLTAAIAFLALLALVVIQVNHCTGFKDAFIATLVIWSAIDWWDALIIDCIWFCHDKKFVIPGTEDLVEAYHDYMFHILGSLKGMIPGVIISVLVGLIVMIAK